MARLAARYADELNLDGKSPEAVAEAIPIIRSRCEEIGRAFQSLRISALTWVEEVPPAGAQGVELLQRYAAAGAERVMIKLIESTVDDGALEALAGDARVAAVE